jgi:hypothetical protein
MDHGNHACMKTWMQPISSKYLTGATYRCLASIGRTPETFDTTAQLINPKAINKPQVSVIRALSRLTT